MTGPGRCPFCGCELGYPTALHILDCVPRVKASRPAPPKLKIKATPWRVINQGKALETISVIAVAMIALSLVALVVLRVL